MRKFLGIVNSRSFGVCIAIFCLSIASFSVSVGCKSPAQTVYVTAQTSTITVESAMGLWAEVVREKHPGPAVEQKVKDAYDAYRKADIALLSAGRALLSTPGDAEKNAWQQAEAALASSAGQLYSLLKDLGVHLP